MRNSGGACYTLIASVAVMMLAGCSGGSSQINPTPVGPGAGIQSVRSQVVQNGRIGYSMLTPIGSIVLNHSSTRSSFMKADAVGKPLVFVADQEGVVDIYLQAGQNELVGQITGLSTPQNLATDSARNVYIANGYFTSNANVLVYAPPYTGAPTLTLDDSGNSPTAVAVSASGVVAVTNQGGTVNFYAKNVTTPCATIADQAHFAAVAYDAFDDRGNLYIIGYNARGSSVFGKIGGACKAKSIERLTTGNSISFARGIEINRADRIAILDDARQHVIYTYNPPKMGSLGAPVSTTGITGGSSTSPLAFAFLASGHDFYAVYYAGVADEYDYPAGGAPENTIVVAGGDVTPGGVAVTPPLVP